jgi:hypothetical protein
MIVTFLFPPIPHMAAFLLISILKSVIMLNEKNVSWNEVLIVKRNHFFY